LEPTRSGSSACAVAPNHASKAKTTRVPRSAIRHVLLADAAATSPDRRTDLEWVACEELAMQGVGTPHLSVAAGVGREARGGGLCRMAGAAVKSRRHTISRPGAVSTRSRRSCNAAPAWLPAKLFGTLDCRKGRPGSRRPVRRPLPAVPTRVGAAADPARRPIASARSSDARKMPARVQRPTYTGLRFSLNARMPSRRSSVEMSRL